MIKNEQKRNKRKVDFHTSDRDSVVRVGTISKREFWKRKSFCN